MNLMVCVKQVPDTMEVTLHPSLHSLDRINLPAAINPFDLYALEAAARLKETLPDVHVTALCMGPERAKSALRDALALCADEAYLLCDDAFRGADLPASKPDPAVYRISAERLGEEPSCCVVLEDAASGVAAAKAAGMRCIAFRNPNSGEQDLSRADWIVDSLKEIDITAL